MDEQQQRFQVREVLPQGNHVTSAFILDTGKLGENGAEKYADCLQAYHWNIHKFNKLQPGAVVLYRCPAKVSQDRKFYLYGGGYVERVSAPDEEGNVVATISHSFRLVTPLRQGEEPLESFVWTHKARKGKSWMYFFAQYGMNQIAIEDFWRLVDHQECFPMDPQHPPVEASASERPLASVPEEDFQEGPFTVLVDEPAKYHMQSAYHFQAAGMPQGERPGDVARFCERMVKEMLEMQKEERGWATVEKERLNLPFDFRCVPRQKDQPETYVEVKIPPRHFPAAIRLSRWQWEYQKSRNATLYIYILYHLDPKERTCHLRIYQNPFDDQHFRVEPVFYHVYPKG